MKPALALTRAVLAAGALVATQGACAATVLWLQGDLNSPSPGTTVTYEAPAATFATSGSSSSVFQLGATASGGAYVVIRLAAGSGDLVPGAYETASPWSASSAAMPRMHFDSSGAGLWCYVSGGRFAVLESVLDSNFQIARFAANFEMTCSGYTGSLYGEVRIDSSVPLTSAEPSGSVVPDPFAFRPRATLAAGEVAESNTTTIYGINASAPITVSGGEYSLNGGAWTSNAGQAYNRDRLKVRAVASSTPGATVQVGVNVGGVATTFDARTYAVGDPLSTIVLKRAATQYQSAIDLDARGAAWTFSASKTGVDNVSVRFTGPGYSYDQYATFTTARGAAMAVGPYEGAMYSPVYQMVPSMSLPNCSAQIGRYVVLEYEPGAGNTVNRFAADFEVLCGYNSSEPPLFGEIRFNSTVPLTRLKPAGSSMPDAFALRAQSPVRAGAIVAAPWVSLLGANAAIPITISNGEYSLNNAPFTSAPGTAQPEDMLVVRTTASRVPGMTTTVGINAGGRTSSMDVTTYAPSMELTGLYFRSSTGDYIGQGLTRIHLAPSTSLTTNTQYTTGRSFSIRTDINTYWTLTLAAPNGARLEVGTYENATRFPFQATSAPGLDFSGNGSGCNQLSGRFVVREAVYSGSDLVKFAVDFEQRCENTGPLLTGELRFNSKVPFSVLQGGAMASSMDVDGTGRSDIVYRHETSGQVWRLLMNGRTIEAAAPAHQEADTNWRVVGEGDFDGNGVTDLLWRHATTGQVYVMRFGRNGLPEGGGLAYVEPNAAWKIVATPDLDGDGKADILWWNSSSGVAWAMLMDGSTVAAQGAVHSEPNTAWRIVAVGDFAGSGKRNQLVWRHAVDGRVFLMTVTRTGNAFASSGQMIYTEPSQSWRILAAADANGDGRSDLFWRNESTGQLYLILMNGGTITSAQPIYVEPNTAWQVAAVGDYDGNGRADVLYRNDATGELYMLLLDGFGIASRGSVYREPNTAWKVLGQFEP